MSQDSYNFSPGAPDDQPDIWSFEPPFRRFPDDMMSHGGMAEADPLVTPVSRKGQATRWMLGGMAETLDVIILALVMFMCVRFVAHNYVVEGGSMLPTFSQSDLVIVNRLAYRTFDLSWLPTVDNSEWRPFGEPRPGDVVVFEYTGDTLQRDFIKRVIATPGQTVEVVEGVVYVDDIRLDEPYINEQANYSYPRTTVGPGKLFLLGDNRNNSLDSHIFGLVDASTVIGRADFRYWPTDRWGLINHVLGDGVSFANSTGMKWIHAWP